MYTVSQILALAASPDGYDNVALKVQTIINNALLVNRDTQPTAAQLEEVTELWSEALDQPITRDQATTILAFSPKARITLALNGIDDTEAHGQVMNALSNFVLGCNWPTYGDGITPRYLELLRHQFNQLVFP